MWERTQLSRHASCVTQSPSILRCSDAPHLHVRVPGTPTPPLAVPCTCIATQCTHLPMVFPPTHGSPMQCHAIQMHSPPSLPLNSPRGGGRGDALLEYLEQQARDLGIRELVLLTTRTADWFMQRGFQHAGIAHLSNKLPEPRRAKINPGRRGREWGGIAYVCVYMCDESSRCRLALPWRCGTATSHSSWQWGANVWHLCPLSCDCTTAIPTLSITAPAPSPSHQTHITNPLHPPIPTSLPPVSTPTPRHNCRRNSQLYFKVLGQDEDEEPSIEASEDLKAVWRGRLAP